MPHWIVCPITATFSKPATILTDSNNEKKQLKNNNFTRPPGIFSVLISGNFWMLMTVIVQQIEVVRLVKADRQLIQG